MSHRTRAQRINDTLTELVDHALPPPNSENDPESDQQFFDLVNTARDIIDADDVASIAPDVNHVSDLIKRKLVRENDVPDQALKFGNLYQRLLAQPVLSQKWAILYLLYQLSDTPSVTLGTTSRSSAPLPDSQTSNHTSSHTSDQARSISKLQSAGPTSARSSLSQDQYNRSAIYDEAFARPGLPVVPAPEEKKERLLRTTQTSRRRDRIDNTAQISPSVNGVSHSSQPSTPAAPTEISLLRDLPFTLQGVSSTNLKFSSSGTLKLPRSLPVPLISLLHTLAEPSLLYKSLSAFVDSSSGGLIGQSLRAAIGVELRSYLGLVATLEGQIRRALTEIDEGDPRKGLGKAGVTLRRCVLWTREATMGLRLMSQIVEGSRTRKGGQLITLIHSYSSLHGDPFVGAFAERLLSHVTRPFYDMLRLWIYDGELSDPFQEFFVLEQQLDSENPDYRTGATSVWEDKYKLDTTMIPSIMTDDFAQKVFLIGKSLNFIRHICNDAAWVESYSKTSSRELKYGSTSDLLHSIDTAYTTTMARLIHLMLHKFSLMTHLSALKKYLLLSQGDFIALLMESLAPSLERPANSQYRHTLTAQLEHAIRNSNAQHDSPAVLRRLDARMLELSHGEIGWDVFTLEYRVDSPLDVVVTPYGSKQYLKVFNFLWRIKRVEFALGATWRRCMTGARGVLGTVDDIHGKDWKAARAVVGEMIHFINQLQYYILFEVIESSWDKLYKEVTKKDATLDDLIQAHATYLRSITRKGLLSSSGNLEFASQLHELLKGMLAYRDAVDGLYALSVSESNKRQESAARVESRTRQGRWGITSADKRHQDDSDHESSTSRPGTRQRREADSPLPHLFTTNDGTAQLTALRLRLNDLAASFRGRLSALLGDLAYQPDTDLRFLGVVMNFNEAYQVRRRGHGGASSGAGHGATTVVTTSAVSRRRGERESVRKGVDVSASAVDVSNVGDMNAIPSLLRGSAGSVAPSVGGSLGVAGTDVQIRRPSTRQR